MILAPTYLQFDKTSATSVSKMKCVNRSVVVYLTELPEDIGNLVQLKNLYMNGNCFSRLPQSFSKLTNLEALGICTYTVTLFLIVL